MKKRHIFLINIVFIGLTLFSAGVVYQFFTGVKPLAILSTLHKSKATIVKTNACLPDKPINGLANARMSTLRKIGLFQQACASRATNTVMLFTSMPSTSDEGRAYAKDDAETFKEFSRYGIRPVVIVEPSKKDGTLLDFALFADGTYTTALDAYFAELKALGLTDQQLGIWNPFPEANLPYWSNNQPKFFAPAVTAHLTTARKYFPTLATSVLLNSATYENTDFEWQNGDYVSLLPYVKGIPSGLVNYAGIQGFPWISRQPGGAVIFNAAEYLNTDLLTEMAGQLGTKKVWFNTATFGAKYTFDKDEVKTVSPEQRKQILMTVREQAGILQKQNYEVSVNIFAQDKSKEAEETDWSYWSNSQPLTSQATPVITDFIRSMHDKKVDVWLFDR